jgi:phytol kinase
VEWLLTPATAAALFVLFAASETALHRGIPAGATRRLTHVVGAGAAATFPLYLQLRDVLLLAGLFTAFLTYTWIRGSLNSIHAVERPSVGALLFPLGLGIAALVACGHPCAFAFGALVLAFADPAAATVGSWVTSPGWRAIGGKKSVSGSLSFFMVSAALATILVAASGGWDPLKVLAVAAILTMIEGCLGYGLDNLLLPLAAAVLGQAVLSL